jgi:hypothetical protein
MFMVNKYFVKVETGLTKRELVGGPVHASNESSEVIGRVDDYNPKTGFMKIELMKKVDYKNLIRIGIPLSNIIFNNRA